MYTKTLIKEMAMMDRQMGRVMRSVSMVTCLAGGAVERGGWAPPADVGETASEVVVMVEVAGVRPGSLSVVLDRQTVTVSGTRTLPEFPFRRLHRMEVEQGGFRRVIPLPCPVAAEHGTYTCDNGILVVRLPKA